MIWDIKLGNNLKKFQGHSNGVSQVIWDNENKYLISSSYDSTIRIWNIKDEFQNEICLKGHSDSIYDICTG